MQNTKSNLRKYYKQKLTELSINQKQKIEANLLDQFKKIDWSAHQYVHIYLPIKKFNEINTYPFIEFLWSINKKVVVSTTNFNNNTLHHYLLKSNTITKENQWGIPEPIDATLININLIDIVIVPLLISDENNYRVGYGKGFYDRFLLQCKTNILTIGLNYFPPIPKIEDLNKYDVPLSLVLIP